jgi:protein gp37
MEILIMSKIEWTDATWNPVTGCSKVSPGCKNCYAEKMHRRLMHIAPHKYTESFLGSIEVHQDELKKPLQWRKSKKIFVNSMSDLFHKDVALSFIFDVFSNMISLEGNHHTYQILTKRPERMIEFFDWLKDFDAQFYDFYLHNNAHIWLGISCENQKTADERIPLLLNAPAKTRFVSCEPLLADVNLLQAVGDANPSKIDWLICGGESGSNARPMHPQWAKSLRDQCTIWGIPFFFKQWGEWKPLSIYDAATGNWSYADGQGQFDRAKESATWKNGSFFQWPGTNYAGRFERTGKSKSGNLLDGQQYLNFPTQILKR